MFFFSNSTPSEKKESILPKINQSLRYENDFENYEEEFEAQKIEANDQKQPLKQKSGSSGSKIQKQQAKAPKVALNSSRLKISRTLALGPESLSSEQLLDTSHSRIRYGQEEDYGSKTAKEISEEIQEMRGKFNELNAQLDRRLSFYELSKKEFVKKGMTQGSDAEFYRKQIETSRKVEEAQKEELEKLKEAESQIKDKDVLYELERVVEAAKKQLSGREKNEHAQKLDIFKTDKRLNVIIRENEEDKYNGLWKILKLQILYQQNRQQGLGVHEAGLDREEQGIRANYAALDRQLLHYEQSNVLENLDYSGNAKYRQLKRQKKRLAQRKEHLLKAIEAEKRSLELFEEKRAREILGMDQELRDVQSCILKASSQSDQVLQECDQLLQAEGLQKLNLSAVRNRASGNLSFEGSHLKPLIDLSSSKIHHKRESSKLSKMNVYLKDGQVQNKLHRFRIASSTIDVDAKPRAASNIGRYNDKNMSFNEEEKHLEMHKLTNGRKLGSLSGRYSTLDQPTSKNKTAVKSSKKASNKPLRIMSKTNK